MPAGDIMGSVLSFMKYRFRRAMERDRRAERHIEAISKLLWPWRESFLLALVAFLAIVDYASTCFVLEFSGKDYVQEGGLLASWAIRVGGLSFLFLIDAASLVLLSAVAFTARSLFRLRNYMGFGRAAFIALMLPYAVVALAAVINNLLFALL